jgi:hypothetical protein
MANELLQEIGLTKYEAEGYLALLRHGALTGYELGKRSGVPLSRSYEVLERLLGRGFALVQPGEPPRYAAIAPEAIVARARAAQAATLDKLTGALAAIPRDAHPSGPWIARGGVAIRAQAEALIGAAQATIAIWGDPQPFAAALAAAQAQGCQVGQRAGRQSTADFALLIDETTVLLGALSNSPDCQAISGTDTALVAAVSALVATPADTATPQSPAPPPQVGEKLGWLDWETRKQRRLLGLADHEAA